MIHTAIFAIILCYFALIASAQEIPAKETWVESEGMYYLGDSTTIEAAQRGSLDAARRAAIEKGVGAFVTSSTIVRNAQLTEDLVHVVVRGIIVDEQILERGLKVEKATAKTVEQSAVPLEGAGKQTEQVVYKTRIKAKIVQIPSEQHGAFSVAARINRSVYQDGDDAEIRVTPSQDAYLYIFGVSEDDHITILAPNRYYPNTFVKSGMDLVFPPETLVKRGIRLQTWTPVGKERSVEKIKVIASTRPMDSIKGQIQEAMFASYSPSDKTMLVNLLRNLAAFDPSEWAEDTVTYEVQAK